ncbi:MULTISPECIES: carotenoid oxygenase family protein [unclassified Nocardia]|uniref:carotenoid oxygenase family protein n=1 Tax=unclassified Nocardia TaxID=2637762 RepID=UPI001CE3EDFE|nr:MULTISPECIES: carotenoid oxygenase family protein [unclassified Nocardia]
MDRRTLLRHTISGVAVIAAAGLAETAAGCADPAPPPPPAPPKPSYLTGLFAPVDTEISVDNLTVDGAIPPELSGRYLRNGPNPKPGTDPGLWWSGAGMIHGIRLHGGRAEWYRNRWIKTPDGPAVEPGRDLRMGASNTNVIRHAGRILALYEVQYPYQLTPDLDTVGPHDFDGRLHTPMTAHPKIDPVTGEMHFFGAPMRQTQLTYHRVAATGELTHSLPIALTDQEMPMMHDFAVTTNHIVWLDLSVVWDRESQRTGFPNWSDTHQPRIGVMPREATSDREIRWFPVQPKWAFHVGNAYEDTAGRIVVDGISGDAAGWAGVAAIFRGTGDPRGVGHLYRWTLDPATGQATEQQLDDLATEFPTINDANAGRPHRYLYRPTTPIAAVRDNLITKIDLTTGARADHRLDAEVVSGETVFVSTPNARNEDDGYLMSIVHHRTRDQAALLILDAGEPSRAPIATVHLPRRVPYGFHGHWIPDAG